VADVRSARRRPTHVAVVSQNADLLTDMRPRAAARELAAMGFDVTLVGGTTDARALGRSVGGAHRVAAYPLPRPARGVAGQLREQAAGSARALAALLRLAAARPVDVVHAGNPPDTAWLLARLTAAWQRRRVLFVFDQHDVVPALVTEKFGGRRGARVLAAAARALERRSFRAASAVVFANDAYRDRAARRRLWRGDRDATVPNGWALDGFGEAEPAAPSPPTVVYIGTIGEQDGVDHLVRAVAAMPADPAFRVVVAGDGPALADVRRLAGELRVGHRFEWLGWVTDRAVLARLAREATVCVAPEPDTAFNRLASFVKLGEYLSVGAPTVAHRLPQNVTVCGDAVEYAGDGSPEALGAAIARLLADAARRQELSGRAAGRFASTLDWDTVGAPRLRALYAGLIPAAAPKDAE
jgi:glycosyltransferase involved in cell wall biosynthesis